MPGLVVTDAFRIVTEFLYPAGNGVSVNTLGVLAPGANATDVGDNWAASCDAINNVHNLWYAMSSSYTATSFLVETLDGSSATQPHAYTHVQQGGASGEYVPATCCVVSFSTAQRGPRGRGRIYVGPVSESYQNGGVISSTPRDDMLLAWASVLAAMTTADTPLAVVSATHHDAHVITGVRVDTFAGTQRRRQDAISGR